jgi:hypothetical protein
MRARRYVDIHMEATEGALASQDYETAARHAQWALENLSVEGTRVIDQAKSAARATKVYIAALGGLQGIAEVKPDADF